MKLTMDCVISGMSGRFSEASDLNEFWQKLLDGVPLYSSDDRRWPVDLLGLPKNAGKIPDISSFDAKFFGISEYDANSMDPQLRLLYEVVFETIVDAGIDPNDLRGTKTSFLVGNCYDDTTVGNKEDESKLRNFIQLFAHRISHTFDFRGPLQLIDTACASSFSCFHEALIGLEAGLCDRAIVAGTAIHIRPLTTRAFANMNMLSADGISKCLDQSVDGYCRSEAVVAILLERKSMAKRIYAKVLNSRTNCDGYKVEGITFPRADTQQRLMEETCSEIGLNPLDIEYIEAHVTGTQAGDPIECLAISNAYRPGLKSAADCPKPLKIGALKSNMGHSEGASGVCSLIKTCKIFQSGVIPPNLNFNEPNPKIEGLLSGLLVPVVNKTQFDGNQIALNSFGFGGVNVHVILAANERRSKPENYQIVSSIPRLINLCNRTLEGLSYSQSHLENNCEKLTRDQLRLLHDVSKMEPESGLKYRGMLIFDQHRRVVRKSARKIKVKKPIWLFFPPLGSQWPGMGKDLMAFAPFADSIKKSHQIVDSCFGENLYEILNSEQIMDNIVKALLGIVSVQMALVDLVWSLDIKIAGIIGHSVGEVAASYADECSSREQALKCAFWLAKSGLTRQKSRGSMAAIGLSWNDATKRCPNGVEPACNNCRDMVTVAGDQEKVRVFVQQLQSQDIFARQVPSCGVAYHSSHVSDCYGQLLEELGSVFVSPKARTKRWFSTSIPNGSEDDPNYTNLTAKYFANMVVSPVNFVDTLKKVPQNAAILELGPSSMLIGMARKELGPNLDYLMMMKRGDPENAVNLLSSIAGIYMAGHWPQIDRLYPSVSYPTARETESIGFMIKWNHKKKWHVCKWPTYFDQSRYQGVRTVDLMQQRYLSGHVIDGRLLFPATGYLYTVWDYLMYFIGERNMDRLPIEFRHVRLHRATILTSSSPTNFVCKFDQTTKSFYVSENGQLVVSGQCEIPKTTINYHDYIKNCTKSSSGSVMLSSKEIYKELRCRGYDYGPSFQGLVEAMPDGSYGKLKYENRWISFADSLMHLFVLSFDRRCLAIPTYIEYLRCDPQVLFDNIEQAKKSHGEPIVDVFYERLTRIGATKGLIVKGLKASPTTRRSNNSSLLLEECRFVRYNEEITSHAKKQDERLRYADFCHKLVKLIAENEDSTNLSQQMTDQLKFNQKKHLIFQLLTRVAQEIARKPKDQTLAFLRNQIQAKPFSITEDFSSLVDLGSVQREMNDIVIENVGSKNCVLTEINETTDLGIQEAVNQFNSHGIRCQTSVLKITDKDEENNGKPFSRSQKMKELFKPHQDGRSSNYIMITDRRMTTFPLFSMEGEDGLQYFLEGLQFSSILKPGGFLLLKYRTRVTELENQLFRIFDLQSPQFLDTENLAQNAENMGFTVISEKHHNKKEFVLLLLRKKEAVSRPSEEEIFRISCDDFSWIEPVKEVINKSTKESRIWLTASGEPLNGLIGMVNCLRKEPRGNIIRSVFSDQALPLNELLADQIVEKDLVMNVVKDGNRNALGSYRYRKLTSDDYTYKESAHVYLEVRTKGDLTSLKWHQCPHDIRLQHISDLGSNKLVRVYYSALNFKDIMVATGRISFEAYPESAYDRGAIGMEFSGIQNGQRVMGLTGGEGIATSIYDNRPMWTVPKNWTLEEAATVPVVYLTVYYALFSRGNLMPDETILIHAGTGGIGQAAINICLRRGNQVFTTVGTPQKRAYILKKFPQLRPENVGCTRDSTFEEMVMRETNGRGVDMVLNSLVEEKLQASLRCLAESGRFIEIGKYDIIQDAAIAPPLLDGNRTFHGVCLAHLMEEVYEDPRNFNAKRRLESVCEMFQRGLNSGEIVPLERVVFDRTEVEPAFRFMASGKHMGKVLIKIRDQQSEPIPIDRPYSCIGQTFFHSHKSYIITGGLGGVGLELAYWMVTRGATKLILTSRNGIRSSYQQYVLARIKKYNRFGEVQVIVSSNLGTTLSSAAELIEEAHNLGPIGGIFNLAMVLSDAMFEDQTEETFAVTCEPKVATTINLDQISRNSCPDLDFFVCFSSAASGKGNVGQANYGFANSTMERVCEYRRLSGLHGLAIQWGAIGDVGVVAETLGGNDVVLGGTLPQRINSCMEVLDKFLQSSFSICSSIVMSDAKKTSGLGGESLLKTICHILGIQDTGSLDQNATLTDLGMDSLMAVEIKQGLERDFDIVLSTQALRSLTIKEIYNLDSQSKNTSTGKVRNGREESKDNLKPFSGLLDSSNELFFSLNDEQGSIIFFFPPIEGNFSSMKLIASQLSSVVIGVNWVSQLDQFDRFEDVIKFYVEQIRQAYPDNKDFNFVGYSYGGFVAWEVAVKMQQLYGCGLVSRIVLLDSSPVYVRLLIEDTKRHGDFIGEDEAYVELLVNFASAVLDLPNVYKMKEEILSIPDRDKKLERMADFIKATGLAQCDANLLTSAATRYFKKIRTTLEYRSENRKFQGEVLLIRADDIKVKFAESDMENDYGLSKITHGKVQVIKVKGDHKSFIAHHGEEIAAYIDQKMNLLAYA